MTAKQYDDFIGAARVALWDGESAMAQYNAMGGARDTEAICWYCGAAGHRGMVYGIGCPPPTTPIITSSYENTAGEVVAMY